MDMIRQMGMGFVLNFTDKTSRQVAKVRHQINAAKDNIGELANEFTKQVDKIEKSMARARKVSSIAMKGMVAGAAVVASYALAAKAAIETEGRLGDVATLLRQQGDEWDVIDEKLKKIRRRIADVGEIAPFNIAEMEKAWYPLQSALGEILASESFEKTMKMGLATQGDPMSAVELMKATMKSFGEMWDLTPMEKADKIFNIVAGVVAEFDTNLKKLHGSMANAGAEAASMNIDFTETLAWAAELQTRGLPPEMAGSAIRGTIRELNLWQTKFKEIKKQGGLSRDNVMGVSSESVDAIAREMKKLQQIKVTDVEGRLLPIVNIVGQIAKQFGLVGARADEARKMIAEKELTGEAATRALGLTSAQAGALTKVLGEEGSKGIKSLLIGYVELGEKIKRIQNTLSGEGMFAARVRDPASQIKLRQNQIHALSVEIGENFLPVIQEVTAAIGRMFDRIKSFRMAHPTITSWIDWGIAIQGTFLLAGGAIAFVISKLYMLKKMHELVALQRILANAPASVGFFTRSLTKLTSVIGRMTAAVAIATTRFIGMSVAFLLSPIGLLIALLAVLTAGILAVVFDIGGARKYFINAMAEIAWHTLRIWNKIKLGIRDAIEWITQLPVLKEFLETIKTIAAFIERMGSFGRSQNTNLSDLGQSMGRGILPPIAIPIPGGGTISPSMGSKGYDAISSILQWLQIKSQAEAYTRPEPVVQSQQPAAATATNHNHLTVHVHGVQDADKLRRGIERTWQDKFELSPKFRR